ncbi:hypothetical protein ACFQY5_37420 [Paeniroseomonas aquatica]|uniref:hypothetical protein n=1 Tax=Paeniroseomonas aquatica TaxID=373043 RepID=UPI00360E4F80
MNFKVVLLLLDEAVPKVPSIATIEHAVALKTIGEVVATLGLDLAFIAPGDLATSMGTTVGQIIRRCRP